MNSAGSEKAGNQIEFEPDETKQTQKHGVRRYQQPSQTTAPGRTGHAPDRAQEVCASARCPFGNSQSGCLVWFAGPGPAGWLGTSYPHEKTSARGPGNTPDGPHDLQAGAAHDS